jgi:glycine/D-amino acid oxidase-like deaminating enzyme
MLHPDTLSYWEQHTLLPQADLTVIGSGIVGLSTAIYAARAHPHWRIHVLERGPLPEGASTRNAGFACFGSMSELLEDMQTQPADDVFALVGMRYHGLLNLLTLTGKKAIGYRADSGYELFRNTDMPVFETCAAHVPGFNKRLKEELGIDNTYAVISGKRFGLGGVAKTIRNRHEGSLDTGLLVKHLLHLAREARVHIYNGIEVNEILEQDTHAALITAQGWALKSNRVVVATNGFAARLLPDLEVWPARNQVWITEPVEGLTLKGCFHYQQGYYYFRNVGNRILLGGGRHLDRKREQTDLFGNTKKIQDGLRQILDEVVFPHRPLKVTHTWSGILGLGPVKRPIVKTYSSHVVVAVRMGGMGVAIGSLIGKQAAAMIQDL